MPTDQEVDMGALNFDRYEGECLGKGPRYDHTLADEKQLIWASGISVQPMDEEAWREEAWRLHALFRTAFA